MYESENQKKKTKITQNEKYIRKNKIERILKRAEKHFNRAECAWGLGLTYYQQAMMKIHHIDQHQLAQTNRSLSEKTSAS